MKNKHEVYIRQASVQDIAVLIDMEHECFADFQQTSRRALRLSLSSPFQQVWVAERLTGSTDRQVVGGLVLHLHTKTQRIFSIAVRKPFQGMGIGHKLMECAEEAAVKNGIGTISLEARRSDKSLITWYQQFGYTESEVLKDYYTEGEDALRMIKMLPEAGTHGTIAQVVVVDKLEYWKYDVPSLEVVSASEYISAPRFQSRRNIRVYNMCGSFRYQRTGYYVSLLAAARDNVVFPSVTTIRDFYSLAVIRTITSDLDEFIQDALRHSKSKTVVLNICFGHALDRRYDGLCQKLHKLFEAPLIQVKLAKLDHWVVQKVIPLTLKDLNKLDEERSARAEKYAIQYFSRKKINRGRLKNYKYDLAILVDPKEENPPSNKEALKLFEKAAEKLGFYTEFITKDDVDRLCEFDALFIRETTRVDNHTYQFSRRAYAEGLVVIDDPWSILHCANKIYLDERMKKKRIPVPQTTVLYRHACDLSRISLSFPLILKQPDSSFSLGVRKVNNEAELKMALDDLFHQSDLIIAQEFMPSDYDWRIGVLDQVPLFACKYFMAKDHWQIYNWCAQEEDDQTGLAAALPLDEVPPLVIQTALKATSLIGDGLYGVDLKEVAGKVYMIEINDNPNVDWGIEDQVLGDKLYETIMQSLYNRIDVARNIARFVSVAPRKL